MRAKDLGDLDQPLPQSALDALDFINRKDERIQELEDAIREHIEDFPDDLDGDEGLERVLNR